MNDEIERNLGAQPIALIMVKHNLKAGDLVAASAEPITYKMVARACKGRRLTRNVQFKLINAVNKAAGKEYSLKELFDY